MSIVVLLLSGCPFVYLSAKIDNQTFHHSLKVIILKFCTDVTGMIKMCMFLFEEKNHL